MVDFSKSGGKALRDLNGALYRSAIIFIMLRLMRMMRMRVMMMVMMMMMRMRVMMTRLMIK